MSKEELPQSAEAPKFQVGSSNERHILQIPGEIFKKIGRDGLWEIFASVYDGSVPGWAYDMDATYAVELPPERGQTEGEWTYNKEKLEAFTAALLRESGEN